MAQRKSKKNDAPKIDIGVENPEVPGEFIAGIDHDEQTILFDLPEGLVTL